MYVSGYTCGIHPLCELPTQKFNIRKFVSITSQSSVLRLIQEYKIDHINH